MKINTLQIKNSFLGWDFEEIKFPYNLSLLVGASGVGKTQILRAINDLQEIANGKSINGFEWKISFDTVLGKRFIWEGAFDVNQNNDNKENSTILFERLILDKALIIDRNKEKIHFNGSVMPKLSSYQSIIYSLKEENNIKDVADEFRKIIFRDNTKKDGIVVSYTPINILKKKYKNLDAIKNSDESILIKLFLCSEKKLPVFDLIEDRFKSIFPQIEALKIEQLESEVFRYESTIPSISIKEKGVLHWIDADRMSSGMLRTIIHISELFLSNDGSVILIDEFENSLGINCIDILTDDIIHENKNLQFIATSHHPYIINNIPYEYWKIVTRKGGHIHVRDAHSYHLGKSKQDAFIQLTKILEKQLTAA